jgi:hypothetical protein
MRVVIKPAGFFVLFVAIAALSVLAFWRLSHSGVPVVNAETVTERVPESGTDLVPDKDWKFVSLSLGSGAMVAREEKIPGVAAPVKVRAITLKTPVEKPWGIAYNASVPVAVAKKETLRLVFWARSTDAVPFVVHFEEATAPHTKSASKEIAATNTWTQHTVRVPVIADYAAGKSQVTFHCGMKIGTVELADIHLYRDSK